MATYQILAHVPEHIHDGLQRGTLVRNAAGVVRWAQGPRRGEIVVHLREIGPGGTRNVLRAFPPGGPIIPEVAYVAIQLATVSYLDKRLDRIENLLEECRMTGERILAALDEVKELQFRQFVKEAGRGYEHLQRYIAGGDKDALEPALVSFRNGLADIKTGLFPYNGEQILENLPHMQNLFRAGAMCSAGEMQVLAFLDSPLTIREAAIKAHHAFWVDIREKLEKVPGPSSRFPSLEMLRSTGIRGPEAVCRELLRDLSEHIDALGGEMALLGILSSLPAEERKQLETGLAEGKIGQLCLVRTGQLVPGDR